MGWNWVNDLLAPEGKKKNFNWNARCPYFGCPSNTPFDGAHPARLKFMQKISPLVYQYKCRDCSCLVNIDTNVPNEQGFQFIDPALWGGKPSYEFRK